MIEVYNEETIKYSPYTQLTDSYAGGVKHTHTYWEIVYTLNQDVSEQYVNDFKIKLNPNSFLIMKPGTIHHLLNEKTIRLRNISVSDEKMKSVCNVISANLYEQLCSVTAPVIVGFSSQTVEILENRLNIFANAPTPPQQIFLDSVHTSIVAYLLGLYMESQITGTSKYPPWLCNFLDRFTDPSFVKLPIADMVKTTNYSHGHFCRQFKFYIGKTLVQYVLEQRLYNSLVMLTDKSKLIIDIALDNGFCSQSSYINAFKAQFGIPPSKWRKLNCDTYARPLLLWGSHDTVSSPDNIINK